MVQLSHPYMTTRKTIAFLQLTTQISDSFWLWVFSVLVIVQRAEFEVFNCVLSVWRDPVYALKKMGALECIFLSFTISWSLLKLMSTESVMPSNHLILCLPLSSHLQSFPGSGSFPISHFFTSGGQSIVVSASSSVFPMNSQDWFPLDLTGLISLQSNGLSRVFSNTTVQKRQCFGAQLSLWSNSHIHTWPLEKAIVLTIQTFVSKVSAFFVCVCHFIFLTEG